MKKMSRIIGIAVMLVMAFSVVACIVPETVHDADCDCETCKPPEEPEEVWESVPFTVKHLGLAGFVVFVKHEDPPVMFDLITSVEQLQAYTVTALTNLHAEKFRQKLTQLDEAFFEENAIIYYAQSTLIPVNPDRIVSINVRREDNAEILRLTVSSQIVDGFTMSHTEYHYLIQVEKADIANVTSIEVLQGEGFTEWIVPDLVEYILD